MRRACCLLTVLLSLYLGVHNGYIALWETKAPQPLHVFPYRAALYPTADQSALENGIPITSNQELAGLLEDYFS